MLWECLDLLGLAYTPQPERIVHSPRRKRLAVRGECNRSDEPLMPGSRKAFFAGSKVPKPHGLVVTPARQSLAVRGKSNGVNRHMVADKALNLFSHFHIPKPDRSILAA